MNAVLAVGMLIGVVVLLVVAVSVMIFILVQDQPESAPAVSFSESEMEGRWTLSSAPREIEWEEYEMRVFGNIGTIKVRLNADAGSEGTPLSGLPTQLSPPQFVGELEGGNFLDFCAAQEEYDVRIVLVHSAAEAIVYQSTFERLRADPDCV